MSTTIRALGSAEWPIYRATRLAALQDSPAAFGGTYAATAGYPEQTWREWCAQPSWFAFVDGEAVGMVRVRRHEDRALPEVISMWVAPSARGTSIADQLVNGALSWARDQGDPGVFLRVLSDNARARAFYDRLGFRATGRRDTLPDGRVELELERRFPAS